jgi:hypothetical protein
MSFRVRSSGASGVASAETLSSGERRSGARSLATLSFADR